jgi:hypothetical protein
MPKNISPLFLLIFIFTFKNITFSQKKDSTKNVGLLYKLMGTWVAKGTSRNKDGSWKTDTTTSTWIWHRILQEKAIQDDWYGKTTPDKLEEAKTIGTNIRIYNENEKKWYMGWIDTFNQKLLSFTATEGNGKLIMEGNNTQGRPVRNAFFNVTENSFDWVQQWTFDDGKTWVDVAKIWCKRWKVN